MTGDGKLRGQAVTLEGVIGAVIVLASVVLALQAVNIAPVVSDGDDGRSERLETRTEDLIEAAADRGALRKTVTCVRSTGEPETNLANPNDPPTQFGELLNQTLTQSGNEFIVAVEYRNTGSQEHERLYPSGEISAPPDAVSVSRQITLYNSDPVHRAGTDGCVQDPDGATLTEEDQLYVDRHPEVDGTTNVYNTVRIRVIAW